ncbi:hypothetical protein Tco_1099908 [Tanacetum coccineum]
MPSFPSPGPRVSYFDDLDFFKYFENEFPAVVYNDTQTSKSDLLTELILSPQHIDEFDLNDKNSLSKYDEEEQNVLYFNDLFPFNIIHPDDLKLEKDNDDNEIDIIQSSRTNEITQGLCAILIDFTDMAPLPPRDQRHLWLCYQVNRVHILDFEGLTPDMRQDLAERMRIVYIRDDGKEVFVSLHTPEEMAEDGFGAYWLGSERLIPDKGDLSDYWVEISSSMDFLRGAPSYTYIRDPVRGLCHRLISYNIYGRGHAHEKVTATDLFYLRSMDQGAANVLYMLAQYLFRHAEGRKSGARLSGGHFIGRLAHHFGLVSDDGLRGLSVVARELSLIEMGELVKLNICMEIGDDWAWVAPGPARHLSSHHHHLLSRVGLCLRDCGDLRRRCKGYDRISRRLAGRHFRHSMRPFGGAYLQHSSDAPGTQKNEGLIGRTYPELFDREDGEMVKLHRVS